MSTNPSRMTKLAFALFCVACASAAHAGSNATDDFYGTTEPFASEAIYFVMTDRFVNGDPSNDHRDQGGKDPALRTFDRPVPDVFREQVMTQIGASTTWRWLGYDEAKVEQHGIEMVSVSGGSRWGAGVWIHSEDLARIGLLWLHRGRWGDRQILPADYVAAALTPSRHGPDYGYLWWLNQKGRNWPGLPTNAFGARGAGNNTVFVSPDHDLVIVWRWHSGADHADAKFFAMVIAALRPK